MNLGCDYAPEGALGVGIKKSHGMNLAYMAKLGWQLISGR